MQARPIRLCTAIYWQYNSLYTSPRFLSSDRKSKLPKNMKTDSQQKSFKRTTQPANKPTMLFSELISDFYKNSGISTEPIQEKSGNKFIQLKPKFENVISSKDLLKDFAHLNEKQIDAIEKSAYAIESGKDKPFDYVPKAKHIELLPPPDKLSHLFYNASLSVADLDVDAVYKNDVYNEVELIESSLYRSSTLSNKFDELMQWTLDGKLWQYPIDNEQDWEEEKKCGFHEHVFLDQFINKSNNQPVPLTAFMELVCAGLGQNPFISVSDKKEHIKWFEQYFADKVKQIESAVMEEKRLSEIEANKS